MKKYTKLSGLFIISATIVSPIVFGISNLSNVNSSNNVIQNQNSRTESDTKNIDGQSIKKYDVSNDQVVIQQKYVGGFTRVAHTDKGKMIFGEGSSIAPGSETLVYTDDTNFYKGSDATITLSALDKENRVPFNKSAREGIANNFEFKLLGTDKKFDLAKGSHDLNDKHGVRFVQSGTSVYVEKEKDGTFLAQATDSDTYVTSSLLSMTYSRTMRDGTTIIPLKEYLQFPGASGLVYDKNLKDYSFTRNGFPLNKINLLTFPDIPLEEFDNLGTQTYHKDEQSLAKNVTFCAGDGVSTLYDEIVFGSKFISKLEKAKQNENTSAIEVLNAIEKESDFGTYPIFEIRGQNIPQWAYKFMQIELLANSSTGQISLKVKPQIGFDFNNIDDYGIDERYKSPWDKWSQKNQDIELIKTFSGFYTGKSSLAYPKDEYDKSKSSLELLSSFEYWQTSDAFENFNLKILEKYVALLHLPKDKTRLQNVNLSQNGILEFDILITEYRVQDPASPPINGDKIYKIKLDTLKLDSQPTQIVYREDFQNHFNEFNLDQAITGSNQGNVASINNLINLNKIIKLEYFPPDAEIKVERTFRFDDKFEYKLTTNKYFNENSDLVEENMEYMLSFSFAKFDYLPLIIGLSVAAAAALLVIFICYKIKDKIIRV
ncbi:MAG: hypothetical protein ACRC42_04255 [Mycoplasma sp.]